MGNFSRVLAVAGAILAFAGTIFAAERGATVREGRVYISPDTSAGKLTDITRGREVAILERSGQFLHVIATVAVNPDMGSSNDISGWILAKLVVSQSTPDGDRILFGEAVDSEAQASQRRGRRGAADDARRLYYRVYDLFPNSPLAGEALYRAADIRWQLDRDDVFSRPSSQASDPDMRAEINPEFMKLVMKKFPGTKYADLAAFHLLDNKMCGDWLSQSKCPRREAEVFENYAKERPNSVAAAEALYNAAYRYGALVDIYKGEEDAGKASDAGKRAVATSQRVIQTAPNSDWAARARRLIYMVENNIPVYGANQQ